MKNKGQLTIPRGVLDADDAMELLRAWSANDQQYIIIRQNVWDDPAAWGILLADVANNIATAYSDSHGHDSKEVLKRIRASFDIECSE